MPTDDEVRAYVATLGPREFGQLAWAVDAERAAREAALDKARAAADAEMDEDEDEDA